MWKVDRDGESRESETWSRAIKLYATRNATETADRGGANRATASSDLLEVVP